MSLSTDYKQRWTWLNGERHVNTESEPLLTPISVLREATEKSKDGRIDQNDFLNHAASSSRYSLFTPMEANIIFHFAGRGHAMQRLPLIDFAQLLDPRWKAPGDIEEVVSTVARSKLQTFLHEFAHSAYNFGLGGKRLVLYIWARGLIDARYRWCIRCHDGVSH